MPHLSPIIWTVLYIVVWGVFFVLIVSFEFFNLSLKR